MKHNLSICVSKEPMSSGIVCCDKITVREKILRLLFGKPQRVMVLLPGDSIHELAITEIRGGDEK